jgi:2-C-methyl-D-erythritol 4-phosphate cytidylyltransferase
MIVLAGGIGRRIGRPIPKQFLLLGGKPLIVHVLEKARAITEIERVIITCPEAHLEATREIVENHRLGAKVECVVGGESRQESAYKGLIALGDGFDSVIIHEAVRPLVSVDDFRRLMDAPDENAMFGIPIPFTVIKGHDVIEALLERDELVNVQLPQKFNRAKLLAAHEAARADGRDFTEDASLYFEYAKEPVRILPGMDYNIKITVPTDTVTAQPLLRVREGAGADPPGHGLQHQDHRAHGHRDGRGDLLGPHRAAGVTMGKVCVITGASQGIGRAAAVEMSRQADVDVIVLVARNADGLVATESAMAPGKQVRRLPYDLGDLDGIPALVEQVCTEFGGIDLLLNVAGYAEPRALLDTTADNLVRTFTINVFAMLVMIREFVRFNDGRPAKVLNVASTAGITARPGWVAYAASKAAVVSLSATLAEELAGSGVKVYTISPGRTATELRRTLAPDEDPSTIMQPEQVARVIKTLLADDELTLDGQNIIVRQQL